MKRGRDHGDAKKSMAVRANASSLLSRQDLQLLVEGLRYEQPLLANEVGTETLPLALLHEVLRRLLSERVSIRDLGPIVEAVSGRATETRSVDFLVSAARAAIGRAIVESLRDMDGGMHLAFDPMRLDSVRRDLETLQATSAQHQHPLALVCGQVLRGPLQKTVSGMGFDITVLAYPELPSDIQLVPIGVIGLAHAET